MEERAPGQRINGLERLCVLAWLEPVHRLRKKRYGHAEKCSSAVGENGRAPMRWRPIAASASGSGSTKPSADVQRRSQRRRAPGARDRDEDSRPEDSGPRRALQRIRLALQPGEHREVELGIVDGLLWPFRRGHPRRASPPSSA